jgi:hypothetical protein
MTQGKYVELSGAQRTELWRRWKAGESLHTIGRAFDRPHTSIHCLLSHHVGIVPAVRRRSLLVLSAVEREDISRGLASGSSIRDIAKALERAVSTVSREITRAMAAALSIEPRKRITKPGSQPCGPSAAFWPSR